MAPRTPDADMYGPVEDKGYDQDVPTPAPSRNGINRSTRILNIMDMLTPTPNKRPSE